MNNFKQTINGIFFLILISFIYSCGSSTGSRYMDKSTSSSNSNEKKTTELIEDFDMQKYKTEITLPQSKESNVIENSGQLWYDYSTKTDDQKPKTLIGTQDGFRVLVLTTDNLEEANQIKTDMIFKKYADDVYIDFVPPFYKVKLGDFIKQKNADELKFKLTQSGYKDAKVISDIINLFK